MNIGPPPSLYPNIGTASGFPSGHLGPSPSYNPGIMYNSYNGDVSHSTNGGSPYRMNVAPNYQYSSVQNAGYAQFNPNQIPSHSIPQANYPYLNPQMGIPYPQQQLNSPYVLYPSVQPVANSSPASLQFQNQNYYGNTPSQFQNVTQANHQPSALLQQNYGVQQSQAQPAQQQAYRSQGNSISQHTPNHLASTPPQSSSLSNGLQKSSSPTHSGSSPKQIDTQSSDTSGHSEFSFFQYPNFQQNSNPSSNGSAPKPVIQGEYSPTNGSTAAAASSPSSNATAFPNLFQSSFTSGSPTISSANSFMSHNAMDESDDDDEYAEYEFDEQEFAEQYDSSKRKDRTLNRITRPLERCLQRLTSAMTRKNKIGASRAFEQLQASAKELTDHIGSNDAAPETKRLLESVNRAMNYYQNEFQVELGKIDAEREEMHASFRKSILDLQQDIVQSADELNAEIKSALERQEAEARASLEDLRKSNS